MTTTMLLLLLLLLVGGAHALTTDSASVGAMTLTTGNVNVGATLTVDGDVDVDEIASTVQYSGANSEHAHIHKYQATNTATIQVLAAKSLGVYRSGILTYECTGSNNDRTSVAALVEERGFQTQSDHGSTTFSTDLISTSASGPTPSFTRGMVATNPAYDVYTFTCSIPTATRIVITMDFTFAAGVLSIVAT